MNILIATDNYPPRYDGISRFLQEIIPALAQNHEVSVIAPDFGPTDFAWEELKLPVVRMRIGDYHPASLHFIKIFHRVKKSDVVFIQGLGPVGFLSLLAAKILGKKTVYYTHSMEWELVPKALESAFFRRALPGMLKVINRIIYSWITLLIVPSQGVSETLYWNKMDQKRVIVTLGTDTKTFCAPRSKVAAKKKLNLDPQTLIVGYHGRLAREKDIRTLLRGFLRFKAKHDIPMKLLIVGDGLRDIRKMLDREEIITTGFQEDVIPYLQAMDIYILSSLTETTSLSVMEAMSCELTVISTPVGYVREYIQEGENGYFFNEKDAVELARKLDYSLDEETRNRLGKNARKTITDRFSWDKTREEILSVFERI